MITHVGIPFELGRIRCRVLFGFFARFSRARSFRWLIGRGIAGVVATRMMPTTLLTREIALLLSMNILQGVLSYFRCGVRPIDWNESIASDRLLVDSFIGTYRYSREVTDPHWLTAPKEWMEVVHLNRETAVHATWSCSWRCRCRDDADRLA